MSLNRLLPLGALRLPSRIIPRQFSTTLCVRDSADQPEKPAAAVAVEPEVDTDPVEITESHRRHATPQGDRLPPPSKGQTRNTSSANSTTSDSPPSPAGQSVAARIAKAGDAGISMDLLSSEETEVVQRKGARKGGQRDGAARRPGPGQGPGQGQREGGPRGPRRDGKPGGVSASGSRGPPGQKRRDGPRENRERERRDDGKASAPVSRPIENPTAVFDTSFSGLFRGPSLVSPARRGARDVSGSCWAKDMEASKARQADMMRLAGSYSLRLPTTPHPSALKSSSSAPERAKAIAKWAISTNPTVPMRARNPGVEVVDRLLR